MRAATRGKKAKAETAVALPVPVESPCDVARRALEGDESALPALQALLDDPAGGDEVLLVLNALGDQAEHARAALVHAAAGGNRAVELVIEHKLERMRGELAGPSPSPVERLLVDRVVLTWLALHHADYRSTRTPDDRNDRLHSRAQARYLAALKALAQVRRLALPVLQVNVAGRDMQVNNATPEAE